MRSYMKATLLDYGGTLLYVDPVNATAYLATEDVLKKVDNPHVLNRNGVNHLVIAVYPDHWHISQVSGYTPDDGLFCVVCAEAA